MAKCCLADAAIMDGSEHQCLAADARFACPISNRSRMCSLDITLTQSNSPWDYNGRQDRDHSTHFKWYLELLIPHVARWRKFAIQNGFVESISMAFSALMNPYAPALETLVAVFATDRGQRPDMEVFSRGVPRLSSMELGVYFCPPQ